MKQRVFLSGGMRNSNWQQKVIDFLGKEKFTFFNPREHNLSKPEEYSLWDLKYVRECDILFAYLEKNNPSGIGLSLEVGYAHGLGKTIVLVNEKTLLDKRFNIVNEVSSIMFKEFDEAVKFIANLSNGVVL